MTRNPPSSPWLPSPVLFFFFFNDTATTEIYTLSLHDALPISTHSRTIPRPPAADPTQCACARISGSASEGATARPHRLKAGTSTMSSPTKHTDRKSTRLNSSHANISYAVFCLKKKTERKRWHG